MVYFWSLPPDVTEAELSTLCQPYGTAMKVLLMHVKHQVCVYINRNGLAPLYAPLAGVC